MTRYAQRLDALQARLDAAGGLPAVASIEVAYGSIVELEDALIEGPAAPAILRIAADERCDMIVMGSRGHGQLSGLLLGSVSSVVAQRAECPVLIVH